MAAIRVEDVIRKPLITEKNTMLMERGQYTFVVHSDANKIQIKQAVQETFSVRVKAVNTMNVKPKKRSRLIKRGLGRISGTERGWKKAVVTLQPGDHIDLFEQI